MILMNEEVTANIIKSVREKISEETKEIKELLGVNTTNLTENFRIRKREYSIWACLDENNNLIGTVTFSVSDSGVAFIKTFYIVSEYRNKGNGIELLRELLNKYPKVECKINDGNHKMYSLAIKAGLSGEKRLKLFGNKSGVKPIWWSNYKDEDSYV